MIDEGIWFECGDFVDVFLVWGGYVYGGGVVGDIVWVELEGWFFSVDVVLYN